MLAKMIWNNLPTGARAAASVALLFSFAACTRPLPSVPAPSRAADAETPAEPAEPSTPPGVKHVPGRFDYYVLSLSWSPQHCATRGRQVRSDDPQCGDGVAFGFVVHGLWPQYEKGYPESCLVAKAVDASLVKRLLRIIPSPRLIQHEWQKHGTCSGLSTEDYFARAEVLFSDLRIPSRYGAPTASFSTTVPELRREFLAANPHLPSDGSSLVIDCQGEYLREVRLCYSKDFRPQPCTGSLHDACPQSGFSIRPLMARQP